MEQFLIDTNIVSDFLSSAMPPGGRSFMNRVVDATPNISIISQIELLCWNVNNIVIANKVKDFIADSRIFDITPEVVKNCVKIRKARKIKTPDAIIAATALTYKYTLITDNEKDTQNIYGLKIVNPHKLNKKSLF